MSRLGLAAFLLALALPAQAQDATPSPVPGLDREALRAEIRAYILENPEVIYEAIQRLEEKRRLAEAAAEAEAVRANAEELRNDGYSHVWGNPEGSVTIVEFADYRCGYCKKAHPDLHTLLRTDKDIRYIRKEFPILGPDSELAARAAVAALMQDPAKYEDFSDKLMTFGGPVTDAVIDRLAERAGIDVARMREDMKSPEIDRQFERTRALAARLNVGGTPTFVFGDKIVRGAVPYDEMVRVVELVRRTQD
jgi:protein-disulfide isomerase